MNTTSPIRFPEPTEEPKPEEGVPVEQPKRRRMIQPVFRSSTVRAGRPARMIVAGIALYLTVGLHAQTTPGTTPSTEQTAPQPVTPQKGWVMFDDNVGRELQMPPEQLQQMRDLDRRYQGEYTALGNEPIANPKYQELTERRNKEVRQLMTTSMYDRWNTKYNPVPNTIQEQRTGNTHTTTPPPPKP